MDLAAIERLRVDPIDSRYKGFPGVTGVTPRTVAERDWNLLSGDLLLPMLVIKQSALRHNVALMANWCRTRGVSLAPHGKTTMSPEIFGMQLAAGAWGITAATTSQVLTYRSFGVRRVLLANELVEPAALRWIARELEADPNFDFYCLVDSLDAVAAMDRVLRDEPLLAPLKVLVELGYDRGRTGARTVEAAAAVAAAVSRSRVLVLAGIEGFEGLFREEAAVDDFLQHLGVLLERLAEAHAFAETDEILVSAGGSIYPDRVVEVLSGFARQLPVRLVLRSGCYVTHDSGMYEARSPFGARSAGERLLPALEAWGVVLSTPEPDRALLGLGKRDVAYDVDLPIPLQVYDGMALRSASGIRMTGLNDQHGYLELDGGAGLSVGDLVGCGMSHPCTAFDKWRLIPIVNDDYRVIDAVHTFF